MYIALINRAKTTAQQEDPNRGNNGQHQAIRRQTHKSPYKKQNGDYQKTKATDMSSNEGD